MLRMHRRFVFGLCVACGLAASSDAARGEVNLEWRQEPGVVNVGGVVRVGLYAVSTDPGRDQAIAGMDVIFSWDPTCLQLLTRENNGPYNWMGSYFPQGDPFGINEAVPPADGLGLYLAQGQIGSVAHATPEGLLVTTFIFRALAGTCGTRLEAVASAGTPTTSTVVWSGVVPGTPVTGELGSANIVIQPAVCLYGDMNCDGLVNGEDIGPMAMAMLDPAAYESTYACDINMGDIDQDGDIDWSDAELLIDMLLNAGRSLRGDINRDRSINGEDISLFLGVILGVDVEPRHVRSCDFDEDSRVDANDLRDFVATLLGGRG